MLRLLVARAPDDDGRVRIDGAELRHLHVRRLGPGDRVVLLAGDGTEREAVLEGVGAREAVARVVASTTPARESPLELVLAPALLKGAKMDLVVEKATELGVARIAPVVTRHAVARGAHVERWRRVAAAAAKQSGRTRVPAVDAPASLAERVAEPWPGLRLVPWERETATRWDALPTAVPAVVVLVGPEGGLADDEVAAVQAAGFTSVTLGPRVLRAETAGIVVVAHCQRRWGDG